MVRYNFTAWKKMQTLGVRKVSRVTFVIVFLTSGFMAPFSIFNCKAW